jgi:tetratricopeptide (TPR) repeat protein
VARYLVPAGAVVVCLGLPILLGVRRPGAVQWSVAPLLAAWAVGGALSLVTPRRGRTGIGVILSLALVASAIPGRLALQRGTASGAQLLAAVGAEIGKLVPKGELIVAETDLSAPAGTPSITAGADSAEAARGYLVVPRDSRTPGRYDDLYWHRWYSGFRWVLLSGARVRENLARADAVGPRSFYQAVEREARLMREWGRGDDGIRLYRIPDDSPWRRPLTEPEIAELRPRAEHTWFLSRLGNVYLEAGQLPLAEEIFRLATAWDPENAAAWNNLGAAFLRRGDLPAAAKAFDEGLKRAPDSFEILLNYGRACSAQGIYQRGEGYLLRAANLRPGYAPVHYELARVFLGLGKKEAAAAALRRTLALDPSTPRRAEIESVLAQLAGGTKQVGGAP